MQLQYVAITRKLRLTVRCEYRKLHNRGWLDDALGSKPKCCEFNPTLGRYISQLRNNFLYPTLPVSFRGDTISGCFVLSGSYSCVNIKNETPDLNV